VSGLASRPLNNLNQTGSSLSYLKRFGLHRWRVGGHADVQVG